MTLAVLALLLWQGAPVVLKDGAVLRAACAVDSAALARLAAGQAVTLRFSVAGENGFCYKVTAGELTGYLAASQVGGTEQYRRALAQAGDRQLPQMIRAEVGRLKSEILTRAPGREAAGVAEALSLLETNQPRQALEMLESLIERGRRDATVLALAGMAAWQSDQPKRALAFWDESLGLQATASVEQLAAKVRKEIAADRSRARADARYFTLRFEDEAVSPQLAAEMASALDEEYARISAVLGCRAGEKITAVVQSSGAYRGATGAADWSGGQFDGRIRIPLVYENGRVGPRIRQTFAHEIVHACLAQVGRYPAWFHEGLAQWLSGERLSGARRSGLRADLKEGRAPRLEQLDAAWSRLSAAQAQRAYEMALAGVEVLMGEVGEGGLRGVLAAPDSLEALARRLGSRLRD